MDIELYKTTRRFSVEYGTLLGIFWSATFLILTEGLTENNPFVIMLGMFMMGLSIFLPFYFAWRYKQHLTTPSDRVSFGMAWGFSAMMFLYASFITGVTEFLFFKFIDKGQLFAYFQQTLSAPEIIKQYKEMGASDILNQSKIQLKVMASLSPLDMALNLFANNILISIVFSFPVAFVAHRKYRDMKTEMKKFIK